MTFVVYAFVVILMMAGFYVVMASPNLVKKIMGLGIFQASVFLLYIAIGKAANGTAPILIDANVTYSNPLPHVLILTAIVVGVATTALGLALVVRIHVAFGSINEEELAELTADLPSGQSAGAVSTSGDSTT